MRDRANRVHWVLTAVLWFGGCGSGASLVVNDAVVALPAGSNSALYLTITNDTDGVMSLIGFETEIATPMLHESVVTADGLMQMRAVEAVEIRPGETVELRPGGMHVMLLEVATLELGDSVSGELLWASGERTPIEALVVAYQDLAP